MTKPTRTRTVVSGYQRNAAFVPIFIGTEAFDGGNIPVPMVLDGLAIAGEQTSLMRWADNV